MDADDSEIVIDIDALVAQAYAAGFREGGVSLDALEIRRRLGRKQWGPPVQFGSGWRFQRFDSTGVILVDSGTWPEMPGVPVIHASMSRHLPEQVPTYEDLQLLHRAVWPNGYALQAFVPPDQHVNLRSIVLHLWGRADNQPLWPINFGRFGTI